MHDGGASRLAVIHPIGPESKTSIGCVVGSNPAGAIMSIETMMEKISALEKAGREWIDAEDAVEKTTKELEGLYITEYMRGTVHTEVWSKTMSTDRGQELRDLLERRKTNAREKYLAYQIANKVADMQIAVEPRR
jgi:hypothetical protein